MSISQKEAVFLATTSLMAEANIELPEGQGVKSILNKTHKAAVVAIITQGLMDGSVDFSDSAKAKYETKEAVAGYTSGMVDNHWRKDTRINGGAKYEAKNPGLRAGGGDEELKNLRLLKKSFADDPTQVELIDVEIERRLGEIKATKTTTQPVDFDAIPEEVRARLGLR
jgi:hypothetical protein